MNSSRQGIGRAAYLGGWLALLAGAFLIGLSNPQHYLETPATALLLLASLPLTFTITAMRLTNIGENPWLAAIAMLVRLCDARSGMATSTGGRWKPSTPWRRPGAYENLFQLGSLRGSHTLFPYVAFLAEEGQTRIWLKKREPSSFRSLLEGDGPQEREMRPRRSHQSEVGIPATAAEPVNILQVRYTCRSPVNDIGLLPRVLVWLREGQGRWL
jgi:hypothetical protein